MQASSPSAGFTLVASAELQAASPVVNPQAVARVARPVRVVASASVGCRRSAKSAGFGKRGVHCVRAASPVPTSSPNMAVKRDWPSAASAQCCGLHISAPSLPCVAASPLLLR
jgi:hypothetical protein